MLPYTIGSGLPFNTCHIHGGKSSWKKSSHHPNIKQPISMVPINCGHPATKPGISLSFVLFVSTDWGIPSLRDKPKNNWRPVPVSKGVQQGCKAAPWLWNAVMTLLQDLSLEVDAEWIKQHANIYADDCQVGGHILQWRERTTAHPALENCGRPTTRSYGLIIRGTMNPSSQAVFSNITTYLGTIYHPCLPLFTRIDR